MSKLYVCATPIGNLKDITLRVIETFKLSDFIICEDTRVTGKLLNNLGIEKKMISMNAFSEKKNLESLISKIKETDLPAGRQGNVCLVSDAGTPGISDPGTRLISLARENNIEIEVIPGASALTAALSGSGFDTSSFTFLGFLPKKKGRKTLFEKISEFKETIVFYESPHRIIKTLEELKERIQNRQIGVYKEITKIHEEFISGTSEEILEYLNSNLGKIKGEFVVIIDSI